MTIVILNSLFGHPGPNFNHCQRHTNEIKRAYSLQLHICKPDELESSKNLQSSFKDFEIKNFSVLQYKYLTYILKCNILTQQESYGLVPQDLHFALCENKN